MSSFALKMIAVFSMLCDHFGYYYFHGQFSNWNFLGRLAFPIFAFQISEGYLHTSNLKRYFKRLFLFAVISQIPFMLYESSIGFDFTLNIFFTLLLGLLCIFLFNKFQAKYYISIPCIVCICIIGHFLQVDYGEWGILLILLFYLCKNHKVATFLGFFAMCVWKYSPYLIEYHFHPLYIGLTLATFSAIIPILCYNGKLGLKTKYLLYIFYPLHLFLFYIVSLI